MNLLKRFALEHLTNQLSYGEACLIGGGQEKSRNHDVHYPFRAASHFKYLCTLNEPNCALLITKTEKETSVYLFKMPFDKKESLWTLGKLDLKIAEQDPLIKKALPFNTLKDYINDIAPKFKIFSNLDINPKIKTTPLNDLLGSCRMLKHDQELQNIQKAVNLSAYGHKNIMKITDPGLNEAELALAFMKEAAKHGVAEQAYPPIIAGGQRACILHYTENNQVLKSGELVLVDAGVEYNGYASDITRTFPVNGTFSPEQKQLYEVVLAVQMHAIEYCVAGQTWSTLNKMAKSLMLDKLLEIGFLSGSRSQHEKESSVSKVFYHGLGHWLGLDVHDPCPYRDEQKNEVPFQPGMVLTIEPGIYVSDTSGFDQKWHHIGIRIEDDILITESGPKVLSAHVPKTIEEIEALCQK